MKKYLIHESKEAFNLWRMNMDNLKGYPDEKWTTYTSGQSSAIDGDNRIISVVFEDDIPEADRHKLKTRKQLKSQGVIHRKSRRKDKGNK